MQFGDELRSGPYPKIMGAITLLTNSMMELDKNNTFKNYKNVMDDMGALRTLIEDYAMAHCPDFIGVYYKERK